MLYQTLQNANSTKILNQKPVVQTSLPYKQRDSILTDVCHTLPIFFYIWPNTNECHANADKLTYQRILRYFQTYSGT